MTLAGRLLGLRSAEPAAAPAPTGSGSRAAVGPVNVQYASPGQPQWVEWDGTVAVQQGYMGSVHVHRCLRKIASDLSRLPLRVGDNPDRPGVYSTDAPLARLLGPAPGGPNPTTSARRLLAWSIVQRLATGRMAWETEVVPGTGRVVRLWPIIAPYLQPIPTVPEEQRRRGSYPGLNPVPTVGMGRRDRYWAGFQYNLPTGMLTLRAEQVFYSWQPSQMDWRQPESALQAAALPIAVTRQFDKYYWALLRNDLAARKLIITPGFDEDDEREAWQEQFLAEMTGVDNAGRVMFAEYDEAKSQTDSSGKPIPPVQVHDLGMSSVDAQLLEVWKELKQDIYKGLGVPESIVGDASDRTFSNEGGEHRNYWEGILPTAADIADDINIDLAPRVGDDVCWFDFSGVEALKRPKFQSLGAVEAKNARMIGTSEWREDVGLPPELPDDVDGDEPAAPAAVDMPRQLEAADVPDRGAATLTRLTERVRAYLEENYPKRVLGWVDDADWTLDQAVPLDEIRMARRPGARDPEKVAGIADAIKAGKPMEPVVLVDTGEDRYAIADGYHRTLAFARAGRKTIAAYIGKVSDEHGPWEREMHDAKLNRSAGDGDRYDVSPLGEGKNWVTDVGGLPLFMRAIAHALMRQGRGKSHAIEMAVGIVENWKDGHDGHGGKVSAKTQAKATKAWAEWEAKKAKAHATPNRAADPMLESGSAGALLPVVETKTAGHLFRPSDTDPRKCDRPGCGKGPTADVHLAAVGARHGGTGHDPVVTGHRAHLRRRTVAAVNAHADQLEAQLRHAVVGLFDRQAKATLSRFTGKRGRQMLRAAGDEARDDAAKVTPLIEAGAVYDLGHWTSETAETVTPALRAAVDLTAARLAEDLGGQSFDSALDATRAAMEQRVSRLADVVTSTTYRAIQDTLAQGMRDGDTMDELTARVRAVFDDATKTRAATIARTETIGALNEAADTYAANLPPGTVVAKEWLSAHDHRVRESHRHADGQTRPLGSPFVVGGRLMQRPGDPMGGPGEVINCRCTTLYHAGRAARPAPVTAVA